MDFTEAPGWVQEAIMQAVADRLEEEFDEDNPRHMELAQEMMYDDWSGN